MYSPLLLTELVDKEDSKEEDDEDDKESFVKIDLNDKTENFKERIIF